MRSLKTINTDRSNMVILPLTLGMAAIRVLLDIRMAEHSEINRQPGFKFGLLPLPRSCKTISDFVSIRHAFYGLSS